LSFSLFWRATQSDEYNESAPANNCHSLNSLKKSDIRSKFKLTQKDRDYIAAKGLETVKEHAFQFINSRVAPDFPKNDGKQRL
jgi:hypothetical protein